MDDKFDRDDIGKLVTLELNSETNPIAQALGANKVKVYGRIMELGDESLKLNVYPMGGIMVRGRKKVKEILYSNIIDYSF